MSVLALPSLCDLHISVFSLAYKSESARGLGELAPLVPGLLIGARACRETQASRGGVSPVLFLFNSLFKRWSKL
jgi:hypothetical protein